MKKNLFTRLLAIGGISLIAGLILIAISLATGGLTELKNLQTPVQVERTYSDIKELDIQVDNKYTILSTSSDNKIHVSYRHWEHREDSWVTLDDSNGRLTIAGVMKPDNHVQLFGGLKTISEIMNSVSNDNSRLYISLPKDMVLDYARINTYGELSLSDLHIKEADIDSYIHADNLTIDKGRIGSGIFTKSHLKQVTAEDYHNLHFEQSTIEGADIYYNGDLTLIDSRVKNSTIKSYAGPLTGKNSTLEQTSVELDMAAIQLENLTVLGDVKLTSAEYLVDIDLAPTSENSISLDLKTSEHGALNIASALADIEQKDQTATRTRTDNTNKLTIVNEHADIKLK